MKILSFGEVLWDVYPDVKHLGGAPLNFAAHAARLGAEVYFASCVGDDADGSEAIKITAEWGVKTDYIAVSETAETGKCIVTLDENNIPTYNLLQNVAYDHIPKPTGDFDVLYFGTLAQRSGENAAVLKELLKKSYREIFVDVNIRPPFFSEESIARCIENATILKISAEELCYISSETDTQKAAADIMQRHNNIKLLMITMGEKGAFAYDGRAFYHRDAVKTAVKSTVGAGDSFSAAFLVNYLNGADISDCLDAAARLSSFVVSQQAAVPDYDGREFV